MNIFSLIGKYKVDKGLTLKDPDVTIIAVNYDYVVMKATITAKFENGQYSHVRECDPINFTGPMTEAEIVSAITGQLVLKKA